MLDAFRLDGKVACVTGAATGLGRAMAEALAEAGADVAIVGRTTDLGDTAAAIRSAGRRVLPIREDVAAEGAAERIVARILDGLGTLHILVNAAGVTHRAPALEFPADVWDEDLRINVRAAFLLSQAAGRVFAAQGWGRIVNVASMLSFQGGILCCAYAASKGALAQLTKALANEWAARGIAVNAIAPGYFATRMTRPILDDPEREPRIRERIPAGRWGVPDDLKGVTVFLASDACAYVHGAVIAVDGGWLAR
ncbi:MAG: SDR family oxidoreductase [Planctomycetes bacterium]|nr:SDR family oxidoreductase [Planctomycetota bacterium]